MLRTERFLGNRIEAARDALEREGEINLRFQKLFFSSTLQ